MGITTSEFYRFMKRQNVEEVQESRYGLSHGVVIPVSCFKVSGVEFTHSGDNQVLVQLFKIPEPVLQEIKSKFAGKKVPVSRHFRYGTIRTIRGLAVVVLLLQGFNATEEEIAEAIDSFYNALFLNPLMGNNYSLGTDSELELRAIQDLEDRLQQFKNCVNPWGSYAVRYHLKPASQWIDKIGISVDSTDEVTHFSLVGEDARCDFINTQVLEYDNNWAYIAHISVGDDDPKKHIGILYSSGDPEILSYPEEEEILLTINQREIIRLCPYEGIVVLKHGRKRPCTKEDIYPLIKYLDKVIHQITCKILYCMLE